VFKSTDIVPFDQDIFRDGCFSPSNLTERQIPPGREDTTQSPIDNELVDKECEDNVIGIQSDGTGTPTSSMTTSCLQSHHFNEYDVSVTSDGHGPPSHIQPFQQAAPS